MQLKPVRNTELCNCNPAACNCYIVQTYTCNQTRVQMKEFSSTSTRFNPHFGWWSEAHLMIIILYNLCYNESETNAE